MDTIIYLILFDPFFHMESLTSDEFSSNSDDSYANTQDFNRLHSIGPGFKKKWFPDIFPEHARADENEPITPSRTNISSTVEAR